MFFRRKTTVVVIEDDRVWKTCDAKFRGIRAEIAEAKGWGGLVFAIAHFAQSGDALKRALDERRLPYRQVTTRLGPDDVATAADQNGASIFVVQAELLSAGDPRPSAGTDRESVAIRFVVIERYPLRAADDAVIAFAASVPRPCTVSFHLALDDPLLRTFGGVSIRAIIERAGAWDEAEPIEGKAVARGISRLQETIKANAIANNRVASAEEWFQFNIRT